MENFVFNGVLAELVFGCMVVDLGSFRGESFCVFFTSCNGGLGYCLCMVCRDG